ncbi:MAG: AMP-binding protein [Proteobacteria bacterium]|nr:AMP-binding protein [Pseudomonadota bacterium]
MPLSRRLSHWCDTQPEKPALRLGDVTLSYGALWESVARRHGALANLPRRARGHAAGQPLVALALGNHPMAPGWLALGLAAPVTLALIDPAWPEALQEDMIGALAPDLVITPENAGFGLEHPPQALPETQTEQPFFIGFTSGTTSRPKAFLRDRLSWSLSLAEGRAVFGLETASDTLAPGPLVHGLTFYALAETLDAGATFTGMPRFCASKAFDQLERGITRLVAVPTMLDALLREARHRGRTLPLTQITTAGAALSRSLLAQLPEAFPAARITEYYGASELGFVSLAHHTPSGDGKLYTGSRGVGRAFPGASIEIRKGGKPAPPDAIGTVFVKSPHPIAGYLMAEGEHAFIREGEWASVGDLGALDSEGHLTLAGRADGMVITGGYNVYPEEVASHLAQAPGVTEAVVLALPDAYLGERLVAVVSCAGDPPDLPAFCASRMARYKVPRAFFRLREWPLTSSGKIARATLARWLEKGDHRLERLA